LEKKWNIGASVSLGILILLLLNAFPAWTVTPPPLTHKDMVQDHVDLFNEIWTVSDESDIPGEGSNPTMEYYPRKYYANPNYDYTLNVTVQAKDPDGIDSVIMHYANPGDNDWNQISMIQSEEREDLFTATLDFFYNSTDGMIYDSYRQVYYVANDTLGNVARSPIMEFGLVQTLGTWTADYDGDLYDTPDLWYLVGSTGHEVTWKTVYVGYYYTLLKDGLVLEQHLWSGSLTINVDGLPLGDHVYQLFVDGGFNRGIDNVTVHVVNELPAGVPTDSVGPSTDIVDSSTTETSLPTGLGTPLPIEVLAIVLALAAVSIVLIGRQLKQY
jgi:hypothetical protein